MNDKSIVLIDGGYLTKLTKNEFVDSSGHPKKLDFAKLGQIIASQCGSELIRTYYYDSPPHVGQRPTAEDKARQEGFDRFVYNLRKMDKFEVRLGSLKKFSLEDGSVKFEQKGVDVLLAIDALRLTLKGKISKAIFITGDADFVPVIKAIKDEGVEVFLYYHDSSVHRNILEVCDNKVIIKKELIDGCVR